LCGEGITIPRHDYLSDGSNDEITHRLGLSDVYVFTTIHFLKSEYVLRWLNDAKEPTSPPEIANMTFHVARYWEAVGRSTTGRLVGYTLKRMVLVQPNQCPHISTLLS
jgi:hypothetical protein